MFFFMEPLYEERIFRIFSELKPNSELQLPRRMYGAVDGTGKPGNIHRGTWRSEFRRIKQIEHFPAKFHVQPFGQLKRLERRKIHIVLRRTSQDARSRIAVQSRKCLARC